jgi:hypothetical protein
MHLEGSRNHAWRTDPERSEQQVHPMEMLHRVEAVDVAAVLHCLQTYVLGKQPAVSAYGHLQEFPDDDTLLRYLMGTSITTPSTTTATATATAAATTTKAASSTSSQGLKTTL